MLLKVRSIAAVLAIVLGLVFPTLVQADRIIMKNGDVITGNISQIVDDEVYIEPSYADKFAVKLAEVVSIEAEQNFEIELDDGRKVEGQLAGGKDGQQLLLVDGETIEIAMTDFAEATEPEDYYDRTSHVDVNMTFNDGNTDSTNNLIFADTRLKLGDHRHQAELTIRRDSVDGEKTKEQDLFRYSYNWMFNEPWYTGVTFSWERDPIRELDQRYTLGAIIGRDIFDDARRFMTFSFGVGYSAEEIGGIDNDGATGLWNFVYEHDFREGDLEFFHNNNIAAQFYGDNNVIFKSNTGFRYDIISDVYMSLSLRYDYETEPAAGAENQDTTLAFGVGAEF